MVEQLEADRRVSPGILPIFHTGQTQTGGTTYRALLPIKVFWRLDGKRHEALAKYCE